MTKPILLLNKAFENRIRLGIMSTLVVNDTMDFNHLKELLEVTDGNLASHLIALEKLNYLSVEKRFIGKKTNTTYRITSSGKEAFVQHLNNLEEIINQTL